MKFVSQTALANFPQRGYPQDMIRKLVTVTLVTMVCSMLAFGSGCASKHAHSSSFDALRKQVETRLGATCDCGSIHQAQTNKWIFVVQPREQRAFSIQVVKREFLTQIEWEKRYNQSVAQIRAIMTNRNPSLEQYNAALEMLSLPDGSYDSIGVAVELQEPEFRYDGIDKDRAEANRIVDEITQLLKPYRKPSVESFSKKDLAQ